MILGGVQFEIEQSYTALVTQAYQSAWIQTTDGNYSTNDRPFTDRRTAKFQIAELLGSDTLDALFSLREESSIYLQCSEGEEVFGVEVDHSSPLLVGVKSVESLQKNSLVTGTISIELELLQSPSLLTGTGRGLGALLFPHDQTEGLERGERYTPLSVGVGAVWNYTGVREKIFKATFSLTTEELRDVVVSLLTVRTGTHNLNGKMIKVLRWGGCSRDAFDLWNIPMEWVDAN